MFRQIRPALVILALMTVLTGLAYPLLVTAAGQIAFSDEADGSEIVVDGHVVGSSLLAQPFEGDEWFQPRPSAVGHNAGGSGGANLGPTNEGLLATIADRTAVYRQRNGLGDGVAVPVDAVTTSASGLDPHISMRSARLQAPRVAEVRGLGVDAVLGLVEANTESRTLGMLGEPRVNVVDLNAQLAGLAR
jgi:K+-transporting ATPase ATPase C chain